MKKLFLTFVSVLFLSFYVKAQQATSLTPGIITGTVCRGSAVILPFTTNGIFEDGNVFKVQIKQILATITWIDAATEATDNSLKFIVPENLTGPSANGSYAIRIVASKPNISSPEIFLPFLSTKPVVNLVGATSLNTNPYGQANLQFVGSGVFPIRVVFEDSTEIKVFNINTANPTNFTINPGETKTYKVAYADNVCGRGQGSGTAKIEVNEIALKVQLFQMK